MAVDLTRTAFRPIRTGPSGGGTCFPSLRLAPNPAPNQPQCRKHQNTRVGLAPPTRPGYLTSAVRVDCDRHPGPRRVSTSSQE
jgi:hypothetical protein